MKKLFLPVVLVVLFFSCRKDDPTPTPQPTSLEITILNSGGSPAANADIAIYTSATDRDNKTNPVQGEKVASSSGKASWSGLNTVIYYIYAEAATTTDSYSGVMSSPLTEHVNNQVTIVLN